MAERDNDDDDRDNANDDVQVEKVAADVATGCNIVHDDWYVTIAYDTLARRPMPLVHFQVTFYAEVCSRGKLPTSRQLFVQHHVVAGDYVVTDDNGRVVTNLDVRPHHLSPEYFAQYFRPTEPPPTYEYEATLMTTTRSPTVAMYVAYYGEIDSGSYRLASFSDRRDEGCIFIKPVAPKFNANPSVSVPLFFFVCSVSYSRTFSYLLSVCFYCTLLQSSSCSFSRNIYRYICIYLHVLLVHYFACHFSNASVRSCLSCIIHVFIRFFVCFCCSVDSRPVIDRSQLNK